MADQTIKTIIDVILKDKDFKAGLKKLGTESDKFGKKQKKMTASLSKAWRFLGATIIGGVVVAGLKKMVKRAAEAEEVLNKFNVVFSDIRAEADAMARELSKSFGLSSSKAKELLADTGDLLTGFGFTQESALDLSNQVNKLAVDLVSFTNFSGGAEGASKALTKALLGERESVKALGIAILESDVKAKIKALEIAGKFTNETNREKRAIATLAIAIEQSKNAQGDFNRSQLSFTNQSRTLKARIDDLVVVFGTWLKEILTPLLPKLIDITNTLIDFIEEQSKLQKETNALKAEMAETLFIYKKYGLATKELGEKAVDLGIEIDTLNRLTKTFKDSQSKASEELRKTGSVSDKTKSAVSSLADAYFNQVDRVAELKEQLSGTNITSQQAIELWQEYTEKIFNNTGAIDENNEKKVESIELTEKELEEIEKIKVASLTNEELEVMKHEQKIARIDALLEKARSGSMEQKSLEASRVALIEENEKRIQGAKKKTNAIEKFFQKESVQGTRDALSDISSLTSSSNKTLFNIGKAASIADATMSNAQAIVKTMASVPYPFNIPLAALQGVAGGAQIAKIASQQLPGLQEGTDFTGGGRFMVGERGPEILDIPFGAGVTPNREVPGLSENNTINNVNNETINNDNSIQNNNFEGVENLEDKLNELRQTQGVDILQENG